MKAIVVGGGVSGLMASWALARSGFKVAVVDGRRFHGLDATTLTAGIVTPLMPPPFAQIALESLRIYERHFPEACERYKLAWISLQRPCEREILALLRRHGVVGETLEGPGIFDLAGFNLVLREGETLAEASTLVVDSGLLRSHVLSDSGVELVEGLASKVDCEGRVMVEPGSRVLKGDVVVLATGAWTLGTLAGLQPLPRLRMYKCEAVFMRTAPYKGHGGRAALVDDVLDFYVLVRGGEALVGDGAYVEVGSPEEAANPEPATVEALSEKLLARIPGSSEWRVYKAYSAPCSSCEDTRPLVGPLSGCERVVLFTGFNGVGVSLAPALSYALARHLTSGSPIPGEVSSLRDIEDLGLRPPEPTRLCDLEVLPG